MKSISLTRNYLPSEGALRVFDHTPPAQPPGPPDFSDPPRIGEKGEPSPEESVYRLAPLAYLNVDAEGRLQGFNIAAAYLLGAVQGRDLHRPLADFVAARHHCRLRKHIARSRLAAAPIVTPIELRAREECPARMVAMSTRPAAEAAVYRTLLLPVSGHRLAPSLGEDARFRALVENSSEVVCIVAPDGTIFYTTPSAERVLGYDAASWFGRNIFEIMRPGKLEPTRAALRALAAAPPGAVIRLIEEARHLDGTWRWIEAILTNLISQPAVGGIVCNYRDITDSRRAEEALRASEQHYRVLAEALPQMISIRDSEGHIEYCNSHWREYSGITNVDSIVHDWRTGIPPEDHAGLRPPRLKDGTRLPWKAECRLRRAADGALRWHSVRIIPLPPQPGQQGASPRWLAIGSDIHERKQAEQERERLLGQLERDRSDLAVQYAVVRVLAESSSLAEAAPRLLAAFCQQLHWQAGALWTIGPNPSPRPALSLVHIRQQPGIAPAGLMRASLPQPPAKGRGLAGRVWREKKPLSLSHLSASRGAPHHRAAARIGLRGAFAFPILLGGEVHGVVELFSRERFRPAARLLYIVAAVGIQIGQFMERTHALDRLRQSEEALIQANNALEQRVRERTAELHDANCELSGEILERTRLEREIIRISEREQRRIGQDLHDGLCQELAAIAFMTRALANRIGKSNPSQKSGGADPARINETARINEVAQLLNDSISRCRAIARGLHPVEMDADGLMVALRDLAMRTDQTIACSFQCKEPILMPESDMALNLYRIAQEAVANAMKYSRATRITIGLDRKGRSLRLSISDDGRGIPKRPRSRARGRAGMGLHIMRYRARTMGAALRIRDRRPHGTEVACLLPRK